MVVRGSAGRQRQPDRPRLRRAVLVGSGFAAYSFGIRPSPRNERLDALTGEYRILHLRRTGACTGRGGPGDLAWVWPLATTLLWLRTRRRARQA